MDLYTGGAWRSIGSADVRVDGQWRRIVRAEVYTGGAWKSAGTFIVPLTGATAAPNVVTAGGYGGYLTTDATTITPTGGLAPYTYSWTRISGTVGTANSASSATTSFTGLVSTGGFEESTFRCTVTDALGTSVTVDVIATFSDYGGIL